VTATAAGNEVLGYWAGDASIIHVQSEGGALSATIVALMDPTYKSDETVGAPGEVRRDDNHPKTSLRARLLIGLNLLSSYEHNGKRWEGKIYDPESGNTYSSRMEVDSSGNLKMRGYIGLPIMGRTAMFEPLRNCTQHMRTMLTRSKQSNPLCRRQ